MKTAHVSKLLVKLKRAVSLDVVESVSARVLQDLLNLDYRPGIKAKFDSDALRGRSSGLFDRDSCRVLCSLANYAEKVAILPFMAYDKIPTTDGSLSIVDQAYLSVTWHYMKTEFCWALVAAVAVAYAKEQGEEIQDNSAFFTPVTDQSPDEFCAWLRLEERYSNIKLAAAALYAKMPK